MLNDATPATTTAEAIGCSVSWASGELAGLLSWAAAVQPFIMPGSFILLAISDGTAALLLDEGHDDQPLQGTELEALQAALDKLGRLGAICGRPSA